MRGKALSFHSGMFRYFPASRPGRLYDRVVDVMEELVRFTWLTRDRADYLVDRYSEHAAAFELPAAL